MSWASGSKQSLNIQCLSKHVSKSFKTLNAESESYFARDLQTKMVVIVIISIPDPFNGFHKNKHNLAITCQSHLEFWDQKEKIISHTSLNNLINKLVIFILGL